MEKLKDITNITRFVTTSGINEECDNDLLFKGIINKCLERHLNNDFGDLEPEDIEANKNAIKGGLLNDRVLSRYEIEGYEPIYIITEYYGGYEGIEYLTTILFTYEY